MNLAACCVYDFFLALISKSRSSFSTSLSSSHLKRTMESSFQPSSRCIAGGLFYVEHTISEHLISNYYRLHAGRGYVPSMDADPSSINVLNSCGSRTCKHR